MTRILNLVVAILFVAAFAQAQLLSTADTIGIGKNAVMVSENRQAEGGVDVNIAYAMYIRGVAPTLDFYLSFGPTSLLGQDQLWVGVGGNAHLLRFRGNSVSLFGVVSLPVTERETAATVLVNPALVVSRSVSSRVSVYSGVNALIPAGDPASLFFTPLSSRINVPVGASVLFGDRALTAEVDAGKLKAVGLALSRVF